jgi:hypothetical protein
VAKDIPDQAQWALVAIPAPISVWIKAQAPLIFAAANFPAIFAKKLIHCDLRHGANRQKVANCFCDPLFRFSPDSYLPEFRFSVLRHFSFLRPSLQIPALTSQS